MQSPSHPESTNLTPRSRSGSWTEEPSNSTATKIRLMCSYGGKIAPRPHDKTLCYLNGDTRIVAIDKNNFSLADLVAKIDRSLPSTHPRPFVLKYQLPSEDLDSLISVTTDEDLENMIDEYDRIAEMSGNDLKPRRIRLFIFSDKKKKVGEEPEVENWFVEGLNNGGIMHKSTDSHGSSINYLLGLEEDDRSLNPSNNNHSSCSSAVTETIAMSTTPTLPAPPRQVDHFSSFDSSSSSPSSNLPPIKVRVDDNQNQRAGLEEGFAQMGIHSQQKSDENFGGNTFSHQNHPQPPHPLFRAGKFSTHSVSALACSGSITRKIGGLRLVCAAAAQEAVVAGNLEVERKLYVGNIPRDVSGGELEKIFGEHGSVEKAEVMYDKYTKRSRRFGFVTMSTVEDATAAIENLNDTEIGGRKIKVNVTEKPLLVSDLSVLQAEDTKFIDSPYKVYVGNLAKEVTTEMLKEVFSETGKVLDAKVSRVPGTSKSSGFGFVSFSAEEEVEAAITSLNDKILEGQKIRVNKA